MRKSKKQGFSLVECVLALGIVAFAFVAILGLIPAGLTTYRQSINISVASQIAQRVIGDCFEADYDTLLTPLGLNQDATSLPFRTNYRYFDEEGNEIFTSPRPTSYTSNTAPTEQFVYLVVTEVCPYIILPGLPASTGATYTLPTDGSNQSATVTVQIVFDPSQYLPTTADFSTVTSSGISMLNSPKIPPGNILTYYAHITRN